MKKKLMSLIPYAVILFINFYLIPLMIKDTGTAMLVMLIVIPLITLMTSIIFGVRNGVNLLFTLVVVALFLPTIFIFYNESAMVYVVVYSVISLVGNILGRYFYNKR